MDSNLYILLLEKEAAGELTKSEKADLEKWISTSVENKKTAAAYRQILKGSSNYSKPIEVDLDKRFGELESKMKAPKEAVVREMPSKFNWLRVAATFALLIGSFFVWQNMNGTQVADLQWVTVENQESAPESIVLKDNSKISLRGDSKITHPETFANNERRVKLEGEAFFEIEKDATKPFVVALESSTVRVLGTSFNIDEEANQVTVYVNTGVVQFSTKVNKVILKKGEIGVFNKTENTLKKETVTNSNEMSWLTKKFKFENTPLSEAVQNLGDVYGKSIRFENEAMLNCPLDISFDNENLEAIAESIAAVFGMTVQTTEKEIIFEGGNCQ